MPSPAPELERLGAPHCPPPGSQAAPGVSSGVTAARGWGQHAQAWLRLGILGTTEHADPCPKRPSQPDPLQEGLGWANVSAASAAHPGRGRRKGSWPWGEARNRSRGGPWRGRWQPGICPSPLQAGHAGPVGWCVLAQRPRVGPAADLVSAPLRAGGPKWPQARCCPPVQLLAVHPPGLPAKRGFPGLRPSGPQPCPPPLQKPLPGKFHEAGRPETASPLCEGASSAPTCQGLEWGAAPQPQPLLAFLGSPLLRCP